MNFEILISKEKKTGIYLVDETLSVIELQPIVQKHNFALYHLKDDEIRSKFDLFKVVKRLIELDLESGNNWDAFFDILGSFPFPVADGYVFLLDTNEYVAQNPADFKMLLEVFSSAIKNRMRFLQQNTYLLINCSRNLLPEKFSDLAEVR